MIAMASTSRVMQISDAAIALRPILNKMGLDMREDDGQTVYPVIGTDGYLCALAFFVGKLGSPILDESAWTEIRIGN